MLVLFPYIFNLIGGVNMSKVFKVLEHGALEHGALEHGALEHGALEHGALE